MKISRATWIAVAVLAAWLLLSWMLGSWMGLRPPQLYYLRGGLAIIGLVGFTGFLLLKPKAGAAQPDAPVSVSAGDIDDNFNEAVKQIQRTGAKNLAGFPVVFFLGDGGAAKTTVIYKSDIAQHLSGQVEQGGAIVPTRSVNFWLAKNTLLVDAGGGLTGDAAMRRRLFRKFSPAAMKSALGGGAPPPRSVVFAVDCSSFMGAGGAEAMAAKARHFQTVLSELSQELGASFPVYVLFTKADKIDYFRDYVANLNDDEVTDVLGITLPFEKQQGAYAEEQNRRLAAAFQQLYYSLTDRRPLYLGREHRAQVLPNIYEFPRQFAKLKTLLVSFLVDLCRPSQLGASPYLRGFYFVGTRTVMLSDVAPSPQLVDTTDDGPPDATRIFDIRGRGAPLVPEFREPSARRVDQWVYLPRFLPQVILADASANRLGTANFKVNLARRILLAAATAAALFMGIWWTISFSNNRALVNGALEAAKGVPVMTYPAGQFPSQDALQRLDRVRETLDRLNQFERTGAPMSYGGFLYSGDAARESVQRAYYGLFRRLLLAPTQERLVTECTHAGDDKGYPFNYEALKSYLITTERHEKSTPEFLTPALDRHWKSDQPVDDVRDRLARQNFEFYSRELLRDNSYLPVTKADTGAVGACREYLNRFGQAGRIYQAMLTKIGASGRTLIFNRDFPDSANTVRNAFPVTPEFTRDGFAAFDKMVKDPSTYPKGEDWVLGPQAKDTLDNAKVAEQLRQMYASDYIKKWTGYLMETHVVLLGSVGDAITKLDTLSGVKPTLLQALCQAGENTSVNSDEISRAFQPVQVITPAGCTANGYQSAGEYSKALISLMESLKSLKETDPQTYDDAKAKATQADMIVRTIANRFIVNGTNPAIAAQTKQLLLAPIYKVHGPRPDSGPSEALCRDIGPILAKYPFTPDASEDASLAEVGKFLKKPDGRLWGLANDMQQYLKLYSGDTFSPAPSSAAKLNPKFLQFLNRSATLAHTLYPNEGATNPSLSYRMTPVPLPDIDHVKLVINGQTLTEDLHGTVMPKDFVWPGDKATGAELTIKIAGGSEVTLTKVEGLWAPWRLLERSEPVSGSPLEFDWVTRQGGAVVTTKNGNPQKARFKFDSESARVLRAQYFKLTCVSQAFQ